MDITAESFEVWEKAETCRGIRRVYAALGDDLSRSIFKKRLLYSILGDREEILQIIRESYPQSQKLETPKLCFYGAGRGAEWFLDRDANWMLRGASNEQFVIDNHKRGTIMDHPIISFEEFLAMPDHKEYTVIVTLGEGPVRREIEAQMRGCDIPYLLAYRDLNWRKPQYFDLPYINWGSEYFVDAGAMDGETTKFFFEYCENGYAYVFEPDPEQFIEAKRSLKDRPNTEFFPYGLYDKNETRRFLPSAGGGRIKENGSISIEVRRLDDLLGDRPVTFIKMDIEGSELAALRGAERIIREQKPKLAISVYHRPEDIWEIPELILDLCPAYKLYLRHYTLKEYDTVLFAISQ